MENQLFSLNDGRSIEWEIFQKHPLGKLYSAIPFDLYASLIPYQRANTGPSGWFDLRGGIALQILKGYFNGISDAKLIELLNHNSMLQMFCGIRIPLGQHIKDTGVVSRWRMLTGEFLKDEKILRSLQLANVEAWKNELDVKINLADATCYESHVRFPTDVKLLWDCVSYLHKQLKIICKYVGIKMPRSKYKEQKKKQLVFQRSRKKTYKKRQSRKRSLLYLLNKYLDELPRIMSAMMMKQTKSLFKCPVAHNFFKRISTIKKVYKQQQLHFDHPDIKIKDRIVSLAKPYLRPIVRGKETKRVEFGIKVHEMQISGINFIEHWSFNAFHEGVRLKKTIWLHHFLFKKKLSAFGGDQLYSNNKNRSYCSKHNIQTCFAQKGRPSKNPILNDQKKQLRKEIGKERSTRLEGSFGNKKNHYSLVKIKARTQHSELAWIFFSNLAANAMIVVKKREELAKQQAA